MRRSLTLRKKMVFMRFFGSFFWHSRDFFFDLSHVLNTQYGEPLDTYMGVALKQWIIPKHFMSVYWRLEPSLQQIVI